MEKESSGFGRYIISAIGVVVVIVLLVFFGKTFETWQSNYILKEINLRVFLRRIFKRSGKK